MSELSVVPTLHVSKAGSALDVFPDDQAEEVTKQFVFRIELYATVEGAQDEVEARISALGSLPRRIQVVELGHDVVIAADEDNVELLQEREVGKTGSFFGDFDGPCG